MNQPEEGYEVSNIGYEELIKMFELAFNEEQWSYDQESVDAYYSIDNKGFFKGAIGDNMISIIHAVRYPGNFAYIGYFLVRQANRRKNNGRVLFDKALEHCKGCVTGIFGVHSLIPFYQKKKDLQFRNMLECTLVNLQKSILNFQFYLIMKKSTITILQSMIKIVFLEIDKNF